MTRRIVVEFREDEYAWLRKNLGQIDVPWRSPFVWQRARMRLASALAQAATDDEQEARP